VLNGEMLRPELDDPARVFAFFLAEARILLHCIFGVNARICKV